MNRLKYPLLVAFILLVLVACRLGQIPSPEASPTVTATMPEASLDEPFVLDAGQETFVAGEGLRLRFEGVLEDSRCPTQVNCFWTGQARITVVVEQVGQEPITLEFNTNPAPGMTRDLLPAGPYTVQLKQLDPYPEHPDRPIPFTAYQATLVVSKAGR
ncbi:MAG: hypothetical protein L0332_28680 [Chloroflexi bacterium]|nr:hypothetical protein [Chloroflexota bacterium]MCI0580566.1 hypothetical protein [Chloroflexota bacterium]MCI0647598.1 hypothetical protein [Chloroflexota bacterium]MCI0730675.1 hypothetical protein [Chloroflexota bacterium]